MSTYSSSPIAPKKRKPVLKWIIILVILAAAIYFLPGLIGGKKDAKKDPNAAMGGQTPASVATVIAKQVTAWSEFSGRIEAVNSAEIRPRVSGQIAAIHFKDGELVKKGQPLFTLDTRPYEAELARARGAVTSAASAQKNTAQDYARAQTLIQSKAISKAEFEKATSATQQANGALETARGAARAAEVNLSYAKITAPISGKISRAELTVGNNVDAGANAPLLASIVDLSPIYASFELDEQTYVSTMQAVPAGKLKAIPVQVQLAGDKAQPIPATIHSFDNQLTAGSGTIRVRAVIPNQDQMLMPGMFAKVRLGSPQQSTSILINPVAVGTDQNKKFVFVVDAEGKAEYREVEPGQIVDGLQIIKSGLKENEQIVVGGLQRLRPHAPVKAIPTDMQTLKPLNGGDAPAEGAAAAAAPAAEGAAPATEKAAPASAPEKSDK